MERYHGEARDGAGNVISNADCYVYDYATGALADIYKENGDPEDNSFKSGADGEVAFSAANGKYNIKVVNASGTDWKKQVTLFDPTDGQSPIWSGNGIYNGKMPVNQYGDIDTAPVAVTDGTYYIDRWQSGESPSDTVTVQRIGDRLRHTLTATDGIASFGAQQHIEDFAKYAGKTVTIGALVKSINANARINVYDGVSYTTIDTHSGGGGDELLSDTVTISPSATQLSIIVKIISLNGSSQVAASVNDYIEFTDARLDIGSHRLSGDREDGEELALCQRYFQKSYNADVAPGTSSAAGFSHYHNGNVGGASYLQGDTRFPVVMRAQPTITFYDWVGAAGKATYTISAGGSLSHNNAASTDQRGTTGFRFYSDGVTTKYGYLYHWTADAELKP